MRDKLDQQQWHRYVGMIPNFMPCGGRAALQPMTYTENPLRGGKKLTRPDRLGLQTGQLHHPAPDAVIIL
jgi:hypothetical protein